MPIKLIFFFCQLLVVLTLHFADFLLCQLCISPTFHASDFPFHQLSVWPTDINISYDENGAELVELMETKICGI
jgi:hypothetical protein